MVWNCLQTRSHLPKQDVLPGSIKRGKSHSWEYLKLDYSLGKVALYLRRYSLVEQAGKKVEMSGLRMYTPASIFNYIGTDSLDQSGTIGLWNLDLLITCYIWVSRVLLHIAPDRKYLQACKISTGSCGPVNSYPAISTFVLITRLSCLIKSGLCIPILILSHYAWYLRITY